VDIHIFGKLKPKNWLRGFGKQQDCY